MLLLLPCGYRPQGGRTGQRILDRTLVRLATWPDSGAPTETPQNKPRATAGRPLGKGVGKDGLPSQTRDSLVFTPFAGVYVMGPAGLEPATYRL